MRTINLLFLSFVLGSNRGQGGRGQGGRGQSRGVLSGARGRGGQYGGRGAQQSNRGGKVLNRTIAVDGEDNKTFLEEVDIYLNQNLLDK